MIPDSCELPSIMALRAEQCKTISEGGHHMTNYREILRFTQQQADN